MSSEEMQSVYFQLRSRNIPKLSAEAHIKRSYPLLFADDPSIAKDFEDAFLKKVESGELEIKEPEEDIVDESEDSPKLGL